MSFISYFIFPLKKISDDSNFLFQKILFFSIKKNESGHQVETHVKNTSPHIAFIIISSFLFSEVLNNIFLL